jgi:hypothetical protein
LGGAGGVVQALTGILLFHKQLLERQTQAVEEVGHHTPPLQQGATEALASSSFVTLLTALHPLLQQATLR